MIGRGREEWRERGGGVKGCYLCVLFVCACVVCVLCVCVCGLCVCTCVCVCVCVL